jgi:hypothetical protein
MVKLKELFNSLVQSSTNVKSKKQCEKNVGNIQSVLCDKNVANESVFLPLKFNYPYQNVIDKFSESLIWKKYGNDVQQGMISDWLKEYCDNECYRRILKEIINQKYEVRTSRSKNRLLTIC